MEYQWVSFQLQHVKTEKKIFCALHNYLVFSKFTNSRESIDMSTESCLVDRRRCIIGIRCINSLQNIIIEFYSSNAWPRRVARIEKAKIFYRFPVRNLKGINHLEDLGAMGE